MTLHHACDPFILLMLFILISSLIGIGAGFVIMPIGMIARLVRAITGSTDYLRTIVAAVLVVLGLVAWAFLTPVTAVTLGMIASAVLVMTAQTTTSGYTSIRVWFFDSFR